MLSNDEQYIKENFVDNKSPKTTTIKFFKGGKVVGLGFCDIGKFLQYKDSLTRTIFDGYLCAEDYFSEDSMTLWNRNKDVKSKLSKFFSTHSDLEEFEAVILYDMYIPRGDIVLSGKSHAHYDTFLSRLEQYGAAYDALMDLYQNKENPLLDE